MINIAKGLLYPIENVQRKLNSLCACLVRFRAFEHKHCVRILMLRLLRKEVIQPQVPLRLPCYDFAPVIGFTLESSLPKVGSPALNATNSHGVDGRCVQGPGTYSPRPADSRLLAIPASCSRVADCNPKWGRLFGICSTSRFGIPLYRPL